MRSLSRIVAICSTLTALAAQSNTLLLVADDVGVDAIGAYREGKAPPPTPTIDALAASGVLFRNAYANPICSPTRATFHTGRYSRRTGVGAVVSFGAGTPLALAEHTLPELLQSAGYAHSLIGKWHLGDARNGGDRGPNLAGWSHYAGHMWNIKAPQTYYSWRKVVNGVARTSRVYATTDNVNDAIAWIAAQKKPWVCCICFNVAHAPFHAPPANLHTRNLQGKNPRLQPVPFFKAMVEAMDTEIGRLLRTLGPVLAKTNVVFVGDNGTPGAVSEAPFTAAHAKQSLYEGGINVPLVVWGPAVKQPGREVGALVNTVDLFHTVAELSGVDARKAVPSAVPLDGVSIVLYLAKPGQKPLRTFAYAERFGGRANLQKNGVAIRNGTYKLIRWARTSAFFNLAADPFERSNLLSRQLNAVEQANHDALAAELARLGADYMPYGAGCAGAGAAPRIDRVADSLPRTGATFRTAVAGLSSRAAAVAGLFGFSRTTWGPFRLPLDLAPLGMTGCRLLAGPEVLVPLAHAGGSAPWSFALPDSRNLLGVKFFQQGLVIEPGANVAGAVVSHGGVGTIGPR